MKRLLLLSLLSLGLLFAQVQNLPDINVDGEQSIKIVMYKKPLSISFHDEEYTALPDFLPYDAPFLSVGDRDHAKHAYMGYFAFQVSDLAEVYSLLKFTNIKSRLRSLYFEGDIDLRAIDLNEKWELSAANGFDITLSENSDLFIRNHLNGQLLLGMHHSLLTGDASVYTESFELGELSLHKMVNQAGYYNYLHPDGKKRGLFARHQSEARWEDATLANHFIVDKKESAWHGSARYHFHEDSSIALHTMIDKHSFIPSLGFTWRNVLDYDSYMVISNEPELIRNSFLLLTESFPQTLIDQEQRSTLVPLNLSFGYQKRNIGGLQLQLELSNTTRYESGKPLRRYDVAERLTTLVYNRYAENRSDASMGYRGKSFGILQSLSYSIPYMPDTKEYWLPYHAPIKLNTSAGISPTEKLQLGLSLTQSFGRQDLSKSALPYLADLSFHGSYLLTDYNRIYINIENILNSNIVDYHGFDKEQRRALLGLEARF